MNARTDLGLGLFFDVPIADYHRAAGVSHSGLGDFAKSPFHYHALHINPLRPPDEQTPAQLVGNLGHCAILEPAAFDTRYLVGPSVNRNTKIWHAFVDSVPSGTVAIQEEQRQVAMAQALSVRSIPDVAKLLAVGNPEVSAFWIDPATGELCRCRPDWVHPVGERGVILVDAKTCGDASPHEFARQMARMGYHRQAAFYSDGYEIASGRPVLGFVFIAVETAWPYAASAVMLDDESIAKGRAEIAELMPRFAECSRTGVWPGYAESIEVVSLPAWALAA